MWLSTDLISGSFTPLSASSWLRIGKNHSAMMWSPEIGIRWWMSATRPATEFSIGIMPRSASPLATALSASSKVGQGVGTASG